MDLGSGIQSFAEPFAHVFLKKAQNTANFLQ